MHVESTENAGSVKELSGQRAQAGGSLLLEQGMPLGAMIHSPIETTHPHLYTQETSDVRVANRSRAMSLSSHAQPRRVGALPAG